MWVITVDAEKCQGDGDCGNICPVNILSVEPTDGKSITQVTGNPDDCLGCMSCVTTCEHDAIKVEDV